MGTGLTIQERLGGSCFYHEAFSVCRVFENPQKCLITGLSGVYNLAIGRSIGCPPCRSKGYSSSYSVSYHGV